MSASPQNTHRATRSYRSTKRAQPCDQCRGGKVKCVVLHNPPCQRCRGQSQPCTFLHRTSTRLGRSTVSSGSRSSVSSIHDLTIPVQLNEDENLAPNQEDSTYNANLEPALEESASGANDAYVRDGSIQIGGSALLTESFPVRPLTQVSKSLEHIGEGTALFLGASSVSDPWLLRHCMFDRSGLYSSGQLQFRSPGGLPTIGKVPVQFLVAADESMEDAATVTRSPGETCNRAEIERIIPIAQGARLIRLYHKHVFHVLPIVSRTALSLSTLETLPSNEALAAMPVYLLAALYATALPFSVEDDDLALVFTHIVQSQDELWRIVYDSLQDEMHQPKLCVLQTALLYLHNRSQHSNRPCTHNSAFRWSFLGNVVALAQNLGLHLECRMYAIPSRERRLRRRLWWATYIEDKWTSLLLGRPPHIQHEECDVSELDETDFKSPGLLVGESYRIFQDMSRLSVVARSLQVSLYSLRSCQTLAEDPFALLQAAKPVFDDLNSWRAGASAPEPFRSVDHNDADKYPITVYFAYLILGLYVWRALLRSTAESSPPPYIVDPDEQPLQDYQVPNGNMVVDFNSFPDINIPDIEWPANDDSAMNSNILAKELYQGAQAWAEWLVDFLWHMPFYEQDEFWYSWSQFSLAVITNFLITLVVQAPSLQEALNAKQLLAKWARIVRRRNKDSDLFTLAMTQLDAFGTDVATSFYLPHHVQQALQQSETV